MTRLGDILGKLADKLDGVTGRLDALESDTGWVTVLSETDGDGFVKVRRIGKTVFLVGESFDWINVPASSSLTLATLEKAYRPSFDVHFFADGKGGNVGNLSCKAKKNGVVEMYFTAAAAYWSLSASWPVD